MRLVPTNKLFKSPLGLFLECRGIARAMPIIIDKIEVFIDFHIYAILEFDIFIGYPWDGNGADSDRVESSRTQTQNLNSKPKTAPNTGSGDNPNPKPNPVDP